MTDRPILFSAPMVRALLAGTKTQTRRVIKPYTAPPLIGAAGMTSLVGLVVVRIKARLGGWMAGPTFKLPRVAGDRLWVRETHALHSAGGAVTDTIFYRATPDRAAFLKKVMPFVWSYGIKHAPYEGSWRSSIHMPRWASRLTLTVTEVRVERLQDITEADAIAEGIEGAEHDDGRWIFPVPGTDEYRATARDAYAALWDRINGAGAWDANPWVSVTTFTVHHHNIDREKTA